MRYQHTTTPQEELARNAAEFRRGLRCRFHNALSAEDVEDIVQTALMNKAPVVDDGRSQRQRSAWFARVLDHAAIDYLRARDGRNRAGRGPRQLSLDGIDEMYDGEAEVVVSALRVDDDALDPERLDRDFDTDMTRKLVRRTLGRLSPEDRRLINLRHRDELSNAELADAFGLTIKGLEKRWARVWVAFVNAAAGEEVAGDSCSAMRHAVAGHDAGRSRRDEVARWEAHLQECPACRVWQHVGARAAAAIPTLPIGGGLASGLAGKLGLAGLAERVHAVSDQIATAVGIGGGGGAGAGVLGAIGGKAAATCITAAVCVGSAAYVAMPVVEHAVAPPKAKHGETVARGHAKAAGASGAQRPPSTTISSAPARVAPAWQAARKATRTRASVQTTSTGRHPRAAARVARETAQAKRARAIGSPFTPEANDPAPAAVAASTSTSRSSAAAPATPPPAPADSSRFSRQFSP